MSPSNPIDKQSTQHLPMRMLAESKTQNLKKFIKWHWLVKALSICAELANFGIFLEAIARWLPSFRAIVNTTILGSMMDVLDPLIYVFRSLIRVVRLVGRNIFNVMFEEEAHGTHPYQNLADVTVLILFCLAIATFTGLLVPPPFALTAAWALALSGLSINWYFDYIYPTERAFAKYQLSVTKKDDESTQLQAQEEFEHRRHSMFLFGLVLVGLFFLLVCGSAVIIAPPAVDDALDILSKMGSVFLGIIGCGRLLHWFSSIVDFKAAKHVQNMVTANVFTPSANGVATFPKLLSPVALVSTSPAEALEGGADKKPHAFDLYSPELAESSGAPTYT